MTRRNRTVSRFPVLILVSLILALAGSMSARAQSDEDKEQDDESWRTASQRVGERSRRPVGDRAKKQKVEAGQEESAEGAEAAEAADDSAEIPEDPIQLDPDGPVDRESYVRWMEEMPRPIAVHNPPPLYNDEARIARVQGAVVLDALIDEEGEVQGVDLVKGLPKGLPLQAYKAVKTWRYEPVVVDGEPVKVIYRVTVTFSLQ